MPGAATSTDAAGFAKRVRASWRKLDALTVEVATKAVDSFFPYQMLWFLISSPAQTILVLISDLLEGFGRAMAVYNGYTPQKSIDLYVTTGTPTASVLPSALSENSM